jgi:hypothetical protein
MRYDASPARATLGAALAAVRATRLFPLNWLLLCTTNLDPLNWLFSFLPFLQLPPHAKMPHDPVAAARPDHQSARRCGRRGTDRVVVVVGGDVYHERVAVQLELVRRPLPRDPPRLAASPPVTDHRAAFHTRIRILVVGVPGVLHRARHPRPHGESWRGALRDWCWVPQRSVPHTISHSSIYSSATSPLLSLLTLGLFRGGMQTEGAG